MCGDTSFAVTCHRACHPRCSPVHRISIVARLSFLAASAVCCLIARCARRSWAQTVAGNGSGAAVIARAARRCRLSRSPPPARQAAHAARPKTAQCPRAAPARASSAATALPDRRAQCSRRPAGRADHGEPDDGVRAGSERSPGRRGPAKFSKRHPAWRWSMHADGGKANQYYLRGYNLDHGTDLAIFVDDMPINLPTHAHGQGYADLNWLMPETVSSLNIRKGPYFADVGDFANAGTLSVNLRDSVDQNGSSRRHTAASAMSDFSPWARPSSAAARCSMPARSIPITARGPRRTTCTSSPACCATAKAPRPTAFRRPRWAIPIPGHRPIKSRCGRSSRV